MRSLLRIKRYHDTIERQAAELADWNRTLEARVSEQVDELERMSRLRRFLSPTARRADPRAGDRDPREPPARDRRALRRSARLDRLQRETPSRRRSWASSREYHAAMGELILAVRGHASAVRRRRHDGLVQRPDALCRIAPARAVRMAVAMRERDGELTARWRKRGHELDFSVGIAPGLRDARRGSASRAGTTTAPSAP